VDVEMGHGFATVGTVVDHQSEAFIKFELTSEIAGGEEEMAEKSLIFRCSFADSRDEFLGDD